MKTKLRKEIIHKHITDKMSREDILSMEETKIKLYTEGYYRIYLSDNSKLGHIFQIPEKYDYNKVEDFFIKVGYEVYERHNHIDKTITCFMKEVDSLKVFDFISQLGIIGPSILPFKIEESKLCHMRMGDCK